MIQFDYFSNGLKPPTRKLRSNMLLESFWILGPRLQATTIRNKDGIRSHQNTHLYILSYDTLPCIYLESNDLYIWRSTLQNKASSNQKEGHGGPGILLAGQFVYRIRFMFLMS